MTQEKLIPQKRSFTVIADAIVPIKVRYTVWAEDEHEAAEMVKTGKVAPTNIDKPKVVPKQLTQLSVFLGNTINKLLSIRLKF